MNAPNAIREMIKVEGITQVELSERLGRSRNYISSTLARNINLTVGSMAKICDAAGYDLIAKSRNGETELILDE